MKDKMSETAKTSEPVEFKGNAGILRTTIWISKDDFDDGQVIQMTIKKVVRFSIVVWQRGRQSRAVPAIEFEGTDRFKHLDAESRDVLREAFGNQTVKWKGKKVELYVRDGLTGGDGTGRGVRVRPAAEKKSKTKKE